MKQRARLIIPVWGERYVSKVVATTLPAVLAPGNLPALCRNFDVELVIVTETRLFDFIHGAPAFQAAARICSAKLYALDDVLTELATDYGITLTHALFRGFSDLGPRMTETYLLFLNADFIVCDGALGHLGALMQQGKRVIHAPSFRVVAEDVFPLLAAALDGSSGTLRLTAREMVRLALAHKHPTVRARTVNQRLSHQSWMDQFYWYVDEDTLIGCQAPVALVAIKPERVVTEPVVVWDFGFLPEAAPTAPRHFIADSDDFFMIEPQSRGTGREMIRIGWTSDAKVARDLSMWLTKEQRESSKQLLTIHAADLPPQTGEVVEQARTYMAEIERRLAPTPASHVDHPLLGRWFRDTTARSRADVAAAPFRRPVAKPLLEALQAIYRRTFGSPPRVGLFHPLWGEMSPLAQALAIWGEPAKRDTLWISSGESLFHRRLGGERVDLSKVLSAHAADPTEPKAAYDICICELSLLELRAIDRLYAAVRPRVKDGGHIFVYVAKRGKVFEGAHLVLQNIVYPSVDISQMNFWGDASTWFLGALYVRALRSFQSMPIIRGLLAGLTLVMLAPIVRIANARAARRDATIFRSAWSSLTIEFTVQRARQ